MRLCRGKVMVSANNASIDVPIEVGYQCIEQGKIYLNMHYVPAGNSFVERNIVFDFNTEKIETETILNYDLPSSNDAPLISMQSLSASHGDIKFTSDFTNIMIIYYNPTEITL